MNRVPVVAVAIFAVVLAVYYSTLCPTIWVGDAGELATAAATLGIAHQPGFPLWTLLGRVAVIATSGEPALGTNLLSAICGAGTAALLFVLLQLLTGRWLVAAGIAVAFAFTRAVWGTSNVTEVYSLNLLLTVASLAAAVAARRGRPRLFVGAAYLLGLGVGNHPFALLAGLPVLFLALGPNHRFAGGDPARWSRLPLLALGFVLGLTVYLYLPIRWAESPAMNWGGIRNVGEIVDHVMRAQYGGLGEAAAETSLGLRLRVMFEVISQSVPGWLIALALASVVATAGAGHPKRAGLAALLLVVTGPLVAAAIRYEDTPLDHSIVSVYFLPAVLAIFVALGLGAAALEQQLRRRLRLPDRTAALLSGAIAAVLPMFFLSANQAALDRSESTLAREYAERVLAGMPSDAKLFAIGDNACFGLLYAQLALGIRADVTLYDHTQNVLLANWGEQFASLSRADRRAGRESRLVQLAFEEQDRPVFYTEEVNLERFGGCRFTPSGYVFQLLRPGETAWDSPHRVEELPPVDGHEYFESHLAGVATYREGFWLAAQGRTEEAVARYAKAAEYGDNIAPLLRNVGLGYLELGDMQTAEHLFLRTAALTPNDEHVLYNLSMLYATQGRSGEALDTFARLDALQTGYPEVPLTYGIELVKAGRLAEAQRQAQRAVALAPELDSARQLLASIEAGLRTGGEAGVLEAQRGIGGLTVAGTLQLAQMYLDQGEFGRAAELYADAAATEPQSANAVFGLGYGLLQVRKYDEAADAFRRMLDLDPSSPDARNALAYIYAVTGDSLAAAEGLVLEAMELSPELGAYWNDTLGWVRYRAGDYQGALAALRVSERDLPSDDQSSRAETEYHLGSVLLALGREDEAKDYFVRSLQRANDGVWVPDLRARARSLGIEGSL